MQLEIERKYHLAYFPDIKEYELTIQAVQHIDQTYLALSTEEEIRIRKLTDPITGESTYTHTYKRGQGLARKEEEYEISGEIYEQLLSISQAVPLAKTRTILSDGKTVFEIDRYERFSLQVVEVEFSSEQAAHAFTPPVWFGAEIKPGEEMSNKQLWKNMQK